MKRILFIAITMLLPLAVFAQTAEECYNKGKSFNDQKDYTKAMEWYLKAAKQGYAQAQYLAGAVYNDRKDYTNAAKWYQKAADQDHASAQINLGALYNNGQGCKKMSVKSITITVRK